MRVRLVQGCVDALVCEVWDVFGFEVGKSGGARKQENEKSKYVACHGTLSTHHKISTLRQMSLECLFFTKGGELYAK